MEADIHTDETGLIRIHYVLTGEMEDIHIPATANAGIADRLWEHTCFEFFCRVAGEDSYWEFNFSPSGQWNHYSFRAYRETVEDASKIEPFIQVRQTPHGIDMIVELPEMPDTPMVAALTAVIEDKNGHLTYWALAHTNTHPDFHHPDSFIVPLNG